MEDTTLTTLTAEQTEEVLNLAWSMDLELDTTHEGTLVVLFGSGSSALRHYAEFILALENASSHWELGSRFTFGAKNICHDSGGLEIEFTNIAGFTSADDGEV